MKSKGDTTSCIQKAWLMELSNARVPAKVARVLAETEAENRKTKKRATKATAMVE